jgi:hypothetical protein
VLSVAQTITQALRIAKAPNYTQDGLNGLNSALSSLCQHYDLALARGTFTFNFNPGLTTNPALWGGFNWGQALWSGPGGGLGSGPYPLPLDYLRASGSSGSEGAQKSFIWFLNGVPYPMVPIDLAEFDLQVQQAGLQSYPYFLATDMGAPLTDRIVLETTAVLTASQVAATVTAATNLAAGQGVAGEGIVPGTTLVAVNGTNITLSQPATATLAAASCMFGIPPQAFVYPPPSGAYPCQFRYQRQMPSIPSATLAKVPWFPDSNYLVKATAGYVMAVTDDQRLEATLGDVPGGAEHILRKYLKFNDDKNTRAQTAQLDRRVFGSRLRQLPNTKQVGWT